jgi:hypothetical protein
MAKFVHNLSGSFVGDVKPVSQARSRLAIPALIAAATALFAGSPAFSQSTFGTFTGTVHDPSGSVVADCIVTVTSNDTSARRSSLTDKEGNYVLVNIEPGSYNLVMQAPGFQPLTFKDLVLLSRQTVRTDGSLSVAGQTQTVSVNEASEAVITTEVSSIAETKTGHELVDLPLAIASRATGSTSPITTLTTQAGVQTDNSGNISVSGAKPSQLSVTIDGISTMSPRASAPIAELFPSFGAISEIRVSEINNAAEFGGVSDITTISKGGSNSFHGGVYENLQNSDMNARNPFSATVSLVKMNDFGGFIGGPVTIPRVYRGRNRTFFFVDYEGLRLPRQTFINESVPSLALRSGDLSVYSAPVYNLGAGPFPGNQIPASLISPVALNALKYLFPLPDTGPANATANNYSVNYPDPISSNQVDLRIDQNITASQTAFFRATYKNRDITNTPSTSGTILAGPLKQPEIDYAFTAAHNFVITPTLVNELRAGLTGTRILTSDTANGVTYAHLIGVPIPQPDNGDITPNFSINGFQPTTSTASSVNRGRTQQLIDNLTWTKGSHTFKFGGDIRKLSSYLSNGFASSQEGSYTFSGAVTNTVNGAPYINNPYAAFLLGVPDKTGVGISDLGLASCDINGYATHYEFFAQDDWKITPRLTMNYGIRWEYHPAFYDHLYNVGAFLPNVYSVVNGVSVRGEVVIPDKGYYLLNPYFAESIAPTPIVTASQAGIPQNLHNADKTEFAPRIGFAYRITKDGRTVLRAGWGKFIETEYATLADANGAVPQSYIGAFTNSIKGVTPTYTLANPFPANLGVAGTQTFASNAAIGYQDPYIQQWNITIERDLGFETGLRVSYEGNHGSQLGYAANYAQIPANTIGYAASKAANASPFPLWYSLNTDFNGARSNYNAMTVEANRRLSHGLQFTASYVFAKNLSNGQGYNPTGFASEGGGEVTDIYNINLDYGNVSFTHRNRFLTTFLYELPVGKGRMLLNNTNKFVDGIVGGWQLSGVFLAQSGPFLTVVAAGADPEGDGFSTLQGSGRADIVSGVSVVPDSQNIYNWINKAAFAVPPNNVGRAPTSSVGSVVGPGTQAVSLSMFKTIAVRERARFQLGIAAANALNHPNYTTPNLTFGTAAFGTITNVQSQEAGGPRSLQLTGRLSF